MFLKNIGLSLSTVLYIRDGFVTITNLKNAGLGSIVEFFDSKSLKVITLGTIISIPNTGTNLISILGNYILVRPRHWVKFVAKSVFIRITSKLLVFTKNQLSIFSKF